MSGEGDVDAVIERIKVLKWRRRAFILAHNYQKPEVQDIADFVGDSLEMAKKALEADADVIIVAGVSFMAEVAAILNPDKIVLHPDPSAGCPLADFLTPSIIREARSRYPNRLECIVSGLEVSRTIIRDNPRTERKDSINTFYNPDIDPQELDGLREIMWRYVGIVRSDDMLRKALTMIHDLDLPMQLKELAKGIIMCSLVREESRGTHFREDYPFMKKRFEIRSKYRLGKCIL